MKRIMTFLAVCLLLIQSANALIVSVDGEGEINEEGLFVIVDQLEADPLTGMYQMKISGTLLTTNPLQVSIRRISETTVADEFCCAGLCTAGNGAALQVLNYTPNGLAAWYAHYMPADDTNVTIEYTFDDGQDSLVLTVLYKRQADEPEIPASFPKKHLIEEFTGQACGYCPYGMDAISEFMANDTNWVLVLHHYGYAADNFTVAGSKTITNRLGVSGAPNATVDRKATNYGEGTTVVFHPGYLPYVNKAQFETTTYASVDIQNTYDSVSRTLSVHVSGLVGDTSKQNLKLTVLIKESGMIDYQTDYYGTYEGWQEFRHANAVRAFLTSELGNAITIDSLHSYAADMVTTFKSNWVPENCMVVAFLSEDFKPVVQAAEKPVVEGTMGGADIEHGGVTAVPVADYYPELGQDLSPKTYSGLEIDTLSYAEAEYTAYRQYGFNFWTIDAYSSDRTVKINKTTCIPFARIYLFTKLAETALPNGIYPFNTSETPGTAWAGVRDDENVSIYGSMFYYVSRSYFRQGSLYPYAQWLITSGTMEITDSGWTVEGVALNGQPIRLQGTTPIDYQGRDQAVEYVSSDNNSSSVTKILHDGRLLLRMPDGKIYSITGSLVK